MPRADPSASAVRASAGPSDPTPRSLRARLDELPTHLRYGIAVVAPVLAAWSQSVMPDQSGYTFLLFYPAVFVSSWIGGAGPGLFATALEDGEIILRVEFPLAKRAAYAKFHHPASGYAMAGVFVAQAADGVRVAVTGAGGGVFRWKQAEAALATSLKPAALEGLKLDDSGFSSDIHADRAYRANLVRVMAKRAATKLSGKK